MTEKEKLLNFIEANDMQKKGVYTFKAKPAEHGTVSGYFVIYNITDRRGDICEKGFLSDSILNRARTGHMFPLIYNDDFEQIIGGVTKIEEKSAGLKMTAMYVNTPRAQEIRQLVQKGILYQLSFSYIVKKYKHNQEKGRRLIKCDLCAISIAPAPQQELALITSEKANYSQQKIKMLDYIKKIKMLDYIEKRKRGLATLYNNSPCKELLMY